ncbi:MAG: hypothetical protein OXH51_05335 [Gemmatimonadetes bacterium]|nr:hypothetical protein [Gemmatimonadota bacterium]MCY3610940.1 hypothetical protein [Gemmatimonadota bacterium]MCY3676490.1 hypothetical protein [Gemmatimonadota bacterium]MYA41431.1 hypothetical protein [Gemmatimonadota bacterium]MYE95250.1 hypothetical protein [Gemmatimonadota bacterium]
MGKPGTDLMATGVIVGSTALAVAATLAFTRANPMETQESMIGCTPHDAHWSVMYAVTVDDAAATSAPAKWRLHTGFRVPRADHGTAHGCRRLTVVTPQATVTANRPTNELRLRLQAIRELAKQRRELREAVAKKIEADRARER